MPQLAQRIGRAKPSAIMQVADKAKKLKAEGRDIIRAADELGDNLTGVVIDALSDAL